MTEKKIMSDKKKSKAKIQIVSEKKNKTNPIDLGVNKNETVGFIASAGLITNLIRLIALPLPPPQDSFEFGKIVLHFDNKRKELWWSNKAVGGSFLVNFGHATYDYFEKCWGDGEVALTASTLLESLKQSNKAEQLMFFADPKKRSYELKQDGKIDFFGILDAISEINTHRSRVDSPRNKSDFPITLDDNYIPILKEEIASLKYGGIIDAIELKTIVGIGAKFNMKTYPIDFTVNPAEMFVIFNDVTSPVNVASKRRIIFKDGTMIAPITPFSNVISEKIEAPAHVLRGEVTILVSKKEKAPVYLLKIDKSDNPNGMMFAGMLIAGKEKINP